MDELSIIKDVCVRVRNKVKGMLGKEEARIEYGRGAGGDISRKIDLIAEEEAINALKEHGLRCKVIAEEAGEIKLGDDGYIILDAIDGTTNAIKGFPFACCSIAYARDYSISSIEHAAVIDLYNGDIYYSSRGSGAYVNGKSISVSKVRSNIIGLNLSGVSNDIIDKVKPLLNKANHIRHLGANALELCFLAKGLFDAYIDLRNKLRVTDMAAALLIAKEAGGVIIDANGSNLDYDLSIDNRISFIAAADHNILESIARDLDISLKV